jgi:hypothetical protein
VTQGITDPEGTHRPARQKVCGACVGGDFDRKKWKAFARSFGPLVFVWFESVAHRVTVLRLFGWKCCFLWAFAGSMGSPFQPDSVCLRVLRQCLLTEQARSQSLTSLTFMNGSVLCGGSIRSRISA